MELDPVVGEAAEESAASPHQRRPGVLPAYVGALAFFALGLIVASLVLTPMLAGLGPEPWAWSIATPPPGMVITFLVLAVFIGELRPVPIPRGGDHMDSITISTTFTVALALLGPVIIAVLAQVIAVLIDDVAKRRDPLKIIFNVSQYTIVVMSTRAVYCALVGQPLFGPYQPFQPTLWHLTAALVASLTFLLVNQILISTVVAFASDQRVLPVFVEDLRFQAMTAGVLAVLAPVAALVVQLQPLMLPLMIAPVLAVYNSAKMAVAKERQANHDTLTGLANRELFRQRAIRALDESMRTGQPLAIMMIDLDHFKEINDTLGHQVGDELICEVAQRLEDARPVGSTVARLGGDEFAVLLPDIPDISVAEDVATYMLSVLAKSFSAGGVRLVVQASLGISLAPEHGSDVHTLMKKADIALYEAKRERARFCSYRPEKDTHTPQRLSILAELKTAIDDDQLFLVYQPKIDIATGETVGAEALVRWQHPTEGVVFPDEFIPLAENTGLITPITWFVIDRALRQLRMWQDAGLDLTMAVNLSVRHLTDAGLPDRIAVALERWGVAPARLIVEVTESSVMTDPKRAAVVLSLLRRIGVAVAIDDYGTGHASLTYLKRLDIDELKIDKSFIMQLDPASSDAIIVASTIELGHNLGLRIVAEGVEDGATLQWLSALGCDIAQGFHIGRPMTPDALVDSLDPAGDEKEWPTRGPLRLVGNV